MPRGRNAAEDAKKPGRKPTASKSDRHHDQYVQLGLTISYYRKLKGLSQQGLADLTGISRTHMSNIEAPKMRTSVSLEVLFNIADALDVPVGKMFETR